MARRKTDSNIILLTLLSAGTLVLSACGSSTGSPAATVTVTAPSPTTAASSTSAPAPQQSATSTAPTPVATSSATAETSTEATSAATPTEGQVLEMLLTPKDLALAGKRPKGRFEDKFTEAKAGPSAFTSLLVTPAECREFAEGPFAGVSPSPDGPITWSAQRILLEGQPSTYLNKPVNVIQTLDIFRSAAQAKAAFERIAASASSCRSYSYEDDQGVIEKDWVDAWSTTDENPQRPAWYQDSVMMFDKITTRFISLDGNALMGLSVLSGNALDKAEVERFGDVAQLARDRVKAGLA